MNLKEAKAEKMRIAVEVKGRVPDPWNYFGLPLQCRRIVGEAKELQEAMKNTDEQVNTQEQREAVIYELADVSNFVDSIEKRLIKLGWLESASILEGKLDTL